jgi:hypothetical protein
MYTHVHVWYEKFSRCEWHLFRVINKNVLYLEDFKVSIEKHVGAQWLVNHSDGPNPCFNHFLCETRNQSKICRLILRKRRVFTNLYGLFKSKITGGSWMNCQKVSKKCFIAERCRNRDVLLLKWEASDKNDKLENKLVGWHIMNQCDNLWRVPKRKVTRFPKALTWIDTSLAF